MRFAGRYVGEQTTEFMKEILQIKNHVTIRLNFSINLTGCTRPLDQGPVRRLRRIQERPPRRKEQSRRGKVQTNSSRRDEKSGR